MVVWLLPKPRSQGKDCGWRHIFYHRSPHPLHLWGYADFFFQLNLLPPYSLCLHGDFASIFPKNLLRVGSRLFSHKKFGLYKTLNLSQNCFSMDKFGKDYCPVIASLVIGRKLIRVAQNALKCSGKKRGLLTRPNEDDLMNMTEMVRLG